MRVEGIATGERAGDMISTEIFVKEKAAGLCECCFNSRKIEGKDGSDFLHLFQVSTKSCSPHAKR